MEESSLRNVDIVEEPFIKTDFGRKSLEYFLPRFINKVLRNWYQLAVNDFNKALNQNIEIIFKNFNSNFYI